MGVLVGVGQLGGGLRWVGGDVGFGDLEEDEFAGFRDGFGRAAEVAGGDPGFEDRGYGVVGVELAAWAAVGVHVREDADGGGGAGVYEDDAVFVGGHGDGAYLVGAERDV